MKIEKETTFRPDYEPQLEKKNQKHNNKAFCLNYFNCLVYLLHSAKIQHTAAFI